MCGIWVADQSVTSPPGSGRAMHAPRLDRVRDQRRLVVALLDDDVAPLVEAAAVASFQT